MKAELGIIGCPRLLEQIIMFIISQYCSLRPDLVISAQIASHGKRVPFNDFFGWKYNYEYTCWVMYRARFFPPDSHYCCVSLSVSPFLLYGTCPGQLQSCLTKLSIRKHFPKPFLSSPSENMSPVPHQLGHSSKNFMKREEDYFAFWDVSVLRWTQFRSAPSAEKPQLFHKIFVPDFTFSPVNIASQWILNFSCQNIDFLLRRGFIQYFPYLLSSEYLHCLILRKYFPPWWPEEALFFYVNVIFWRTSLS